MREQRLRPTQRQQVDVRPGGGQLQVTQPLRVRGERPASAEVAEALGLATNIATPLAQEAERQNAADALAAVESGEIESVDDIDQGIFGSPAFRRTAKRALGNKRRIEFEQQLLQEVDEFRRGQPDLEPDELDEFINGRIGEFLTDPETGEIRPVLDDADVLSSVVPRLERARTQILNGFTEQVREETQTEVEGAVIRQHEADFKATGEFDHQAFLDDVRDVSRSGAEANALALRTLGALAIENGRPDLLENVPDSRPDGTPSFKFALRDQFRTALTQARNARDRLEAEAAREQAQEQKALQDANARSLTVRAISGDQSVLQDLQVLGASGGLRGEQIRTVNSFLQTRMGQIESAGVNNRAITQLESELRLGIHQGQEGMDEIASLQASGALGSGDEMETNARNLFNALEDGERRAAAREESSNRATRMLDSNINDIYGISGPISDLTGNQRILAAQAVSLKEELIEEAGGPGEIDVAKAREIQRQVQSTIPINPTVGGDSDLSLAPLFGVETDVDGFSAEARVLRRAVETGDISALKGRSGNATRLQRAVDAGVIDAEEANALAEKLL